MLFALIHALLYRLRGHDFTDFYDFHLGEPAPKYAKWLDLITSKTGYVIAVFVAASLFYGIQSALFISLGLGLAIIKGWTFDALREDRSLTEKLRGMASLLLRSIPFAAVPAGLYLFNFGLAFNPVLLAVLLPLLMPVVQFSAGYIYALAENAQKKEKLIDRLWKGRAEVYELAFGFILGLAIDLMFSKEPVIEGVLV